MRVEELWTELGISNPQGPLEVPLRFRADQPLVDKLDKLEASLAGAGYRVSRSEILRALLAAAVDELEEAFPQLRDVKLPGAGIR